MNFWTQPFWMPRFLGNALWACRLFLRISNLVFSPSLNGLCSSVSPKWSRRYSWGCKWSAASLPVARILPKPSKGFAKARPTTACDQCWHSRLTAFLAKGVFQIMLVVFPPGLTFNMLSVQQVIRTTGLSSHRAYKHGAAGSYWLL